VVSKHYCHSLVSPIAPLVRDHALSRRPGLQFIMAVYRGHHFDIRAAVGALLLFLGTYISGSTNFQGFVGPGDWEHSDFKHRELALSLSVRSLEEGEAQGSVSPRTSSPCWTPPWAVGMGELDHNPWHQALDCSRKGALAPSMPLGTSCVTDASMDTTRQVSPLCSGHSHHQLCSPYSAISVHSKTQERLCAQNRAWIFLSWAESIHL